MRRSSCALRKSLLPIRFITTSTKAVRPKGFEDEKRVRVIAGHGGNGTVSFLREKAKPFGGPDGGDGGRGGDIFLVATSTMTDLSKVQSQYKASSARDGSGANRSGRSGEDVVVEVPVGTMVRCEILPPKERDEFGDEIPAWEVPRGDPIETRFFDMSYHGMKRRVVKGGMGGMGNQNFASAIQRTPLKASQGDDGEEAILHLSLRLMADVGLVGLPNAGKSTFLKAVTRATPAIAPYPFTTLHPYVGTVVPGDPRLSRFTVADLPGLIEGAHDNKGLGHEFLKHVQRCSVVAYVLDLAPPRSPQGVAAAGTDAGSQYLSARLLRLRHEHVPWEDLRVLQQELRIYDAGLAERPCVVLANKTDLPESADMLRALRTKVPKSIPVLGMSAETGEGVGAALQVLHDMVLEARVHDQQAEAAEASKEQEAEAAQQRLDDIATRPRRVRRGRKSDKELATSNPLY